MNGYTIAVVLHVVVAVLGIGQVGGVAVAVSSAHRGGTPLAQVVTWLVPLLRTMRVSLAVMVATGVWLDFAVHGAHHHFWWLRLSVILVVITFILHRRALATLSRASRADGDAADAYRRVERIAWSMCGAVAIITALMQMKPF